jgi:hypothetical protein
MRRSNIIGLAIIVLSVAALAWPAAASAQAAAQAGTTLKPEALAGKYQGTATTSDGETPITVTLTADKGVLTGTIEIHEAIVTVTGSSITGDKLTLNIDMGGNPGTITGTMHGDQFQGTWTLGAESGAVKVTRATGQAADKPAGEKPQADGAAPAKPAAAAGADPLTGSWDGVTGNGEMSVPFTMNLKLEGERVTGDISSEQGGVTFNPGVFKDGALSLSFEFSGMGTVTMVGALKDGKLVGTMDFAGQMQMSWAAVKK